LFFSEVDSTIAEAPATVVEVVVDSTATVVGVVVEEEEEDFATATVILTKIHI
jgi:hypothetical protein